MRGYMGNGYSWSALVLGMVGMLLFRVLLITAVVAMIKYARGTGISSECRQENKPFTIASRVPITRRSRQTGVIRDNETTAR